jgi:hypothetical protein
VDTAPQRMSCGKSAMVSAKNDPLLGPDGRVGLALLRLWTYAAVCGVSAMGLGRAMVSLTESVLPATPVRLASITVVVLAAGFSAEWVLSKVNALVARRQALTTALGRLAGRPAAPATPQPSNDRDHRYPSAG